jgi:hypothetical protein
MRSDAQQAARLQPRPRNLWPFSKLSTVLVLKSTGNGHAKSVGYHQAEDMLKSLGA